MCWCPGMGKKEPSTELIGPDQKISAAKRAKIVKDELEWTESWFMRKKRLRRMRRDTFSTRQAGFCGYDDIIVHRGQIYRLPGTLADLCCTLMHLKKATDGILAQGGVNDYPWTDENESLSSVDGKLTSYMTVGAKLQRPIKLLVRESL